MLDFIFGWIQFGLLFYATVSLGTFIVPFLLQAFVWNKEQDLKKKYNASWALVTGGSSGIGRAIVEKLAAQGINVVLVALEDDLLKDFSKKIAGDYPKLQFRTVGVDLGSEGYLAQIIKATEDITPSLVFNNAGYVLVGLFADLPLERQLKNLEVNAVCAMKITHHFLNKMMAAKVKGAIIFTSSPSGLLPTPTTIMYSSTKAFLTTFAASLAPEVREDGIDVLVVHPSPVDTNFYKSDTVSKHDLLVLAGKHAAPPTLIASTIFSSVGRGGSIRDQGVVTFILRVFLKLLDYNLFAMLYFVVLPLQQEYKRLRAERNSKKNN